MLKAFIGTFDAAGLRTLRFEDAGPDRPTFYEPGSLPFWAVLDSDELPAIERSIVIGERETALQLLVGVARSFGPVAK